MLFDKPENKLERYIKDNNISESSFRDQIVESYNFGGIGFKWASQALSAYQKELDGTVIDFNDYSKEDEDTQDKEDKEDNEDN